MSIDQIGGQYWFKLVNTGRLVSWNTDGQEKVFLLYM